MANTNIEAIALAVHAFDADACIEAVRSMGNPWERIAHPTLASSIRECYKSVCNVDGIFDAYSTSTIFDWVCWLGYREDILANACSGIHFSLPSAPDLASSRREHLLRILEYLLLQGMPKSPVPGWTLPWLAICRRPDLITQCLKSGMNPDVLDPLGGCSALHWSAGVGDVATVRALIAHGADMNLTSAGYNANALNYAVSNQQAEVVLYLLSQDISILTSQKGAHTALIDSLSKQGPGLGSAILKAMANRNIELYPYDVYAVYVDCNEADFVNLMRLYDNEYSTRQHTADDTTDYIRNSWQEAKDSNLDTALIMAIKYRNDEAASFFIEHGVDLNAENASHNTAADYLATCLEKMPKTVAKMKKCNQYARYDSPAVQEYIETLHTEKSRHMILNIIAFAKPGSER